MKNPIFTQHVRSFMLNLRDIITSYIAKKISPNTITVIGMLINLLAGVFFYKGLNFAAAVAIIFAGAMDVLDGSVAKKTGKITQFGAFLDSTLDRYSDIFILAGIFLFYLANQQYILMYMTISALSGSLMISYTRARAELVIQECKAGFWERPERLVYILLGCVFNNIGLVIIILGIFTHITALARIRLTFQRADNKQKPVKSNTLLKIFFWEYERYTLAYDIKVIILILLVIFIRV